MTKLPSIGILKLVNGITGVIHSADGPRSFQVRRHINHIRKCNSVSLSSTLHKSIENPDYPSQSSTTEAKVLEELAQPEEGSGSQPMMLNLEDLLETDYIMKGILNQVRRNCNSLNNYLCYNFIL